jgi:hypothetical protein
LFLLVRTIILSRLLQGSFGHLAIIPEVLVELLEAWNSRR